MKISKLAENLQQSFQIKQTFVTCIDLRVLLVKFCYHIFDFQICSEEVNIVKVLEKRNVKMDDLHIVVCFMLKMRVK